MSKAAQANSLKQRDWEREWSALAPADKEADLASSKQLLFSLTLHLCSKFHRLPGYEGPESALFTHTAEPAAQSSQRMH